MHSISLISLSKGKLVNEAKSTSLTFVMLPLLSGVEADWEAIKFNEFAFEFEFEDDETAFEIESEIEFADETEAAEPDVFDVDDDKDVFNIFIKENLIDLSRYRTFSSNLIAINSPWFDLTMIELTTLNKIDPSFWTIILYFLKCGK